MSLAAYRHTQQVAASPRQTEHRLFSQITSSMLDAETRGLTGSALVDVLHRNRELWSTLADDCRSPANRLTDELRAGIISLSLWVDRHSSSVVRGEQAIGDLIAVNRTVMEGLRQTIPVEA